MNSGTTVPNANPVGLAVERSSNDKETGGECLFLARRCGRGPGGNGEFWAGELGGSLASPKIGSTPDWPVMTGKIVTWTRSTMPAAMRVGSTTGCHENVTAHPTPPSAERLRLQRRHLRWSHPASREERRECSTPRRLTAPASWKPRDRAPRHFLQKTTSRRSADEWRLQRPSAALGRIAPDGGREVRVLACPNSHPSHRHENPTRRGSRTRRTCK